MLITLGFILLITVITVAFLVRSRSSLQTSQSYSREMIAKEVGEVGINTITAQFQKEITFRTDQMLLPPRVGVTNTNPRNSALIRRTTGDATAYDAYKSTDFCDPVFSALPHTNLASTNSTSIPAKNGWSFATNRWEAPKLLRTGENFTPPHWVYVDDQGPTKTGSMNIIGRFAAMVYDVGGLLDINEAGVPASIMSKGDKGSTAFADLSALPGGASLTVGDWRGSKATLDDYYGNSTVTDPTKAGRIESPAAKQKAGDNRFFSRMELIEAAKAGNLGLSEPLLPYFRTRSEAANRLSVESLFAYGTNDTIDLAHADLKATKNIDFKFTYNGTDVSVVRIDGSTEPPYTIKLGESLFKNRFPLARLRWLAERDTDGTPKPMSPDSTETKEQRQAKIKRYFGLTWDDTNKLFIYTSPDSNTAVNTIKTLKDLATQINSASAGSSLIREPDFFEWLKAAINPDSIGQTGGSTSREYPNPSTGSLTGTMNVGWEYSKDLHVLRIGANIIDQSDPDSIPTGIRSQFTGVSPSPFDSFGQENLPGLNEAVVSIYRPDNAKLEGYLQFELWNPHREAAQGGRTLRGYDGKPIKSIGIGTTKGTMVFEPSVYIPADNRYPKSPNPGYEGGNPTWGAYLNIADFSTGDLSSLDNPSALRAGAFHATNLANQFFDIPVTATGFFSEPRIASKSGPDSANSAKSGAGSVAALGKGEQLYLGSTPADKVNALLFCTVDAPNVAFSGVRLACTANATTGASNNDGIYMLNAADIDVPTKIATTDPSGAKCYNSVQIYSYTNGVFNGVTTSPATMQIEVETNDGKRFPVNRYQNLALGITKLANDSEGRINGIFSGLHNTQTESAATTGWTKSSATSFFSNWNQVSIRKGFPMTDPRTERFGLSTQNEASPGQGIFPRANLAWVDGSGINPSMPCGTLTAVGRQLLNTGYWDSQSPAAQVKPFTITATNTAGKTVTSKFNGGAPMDWQLFDINVSDSVPAYLARNQWMDSSNGGIANPYASCSYGTSYQGHAYKDYDGVVRPGDARWVGWGAHPALPLPAPYPSNPTDAQKDILAARPTILDRPFRNVAELGCVFRDVPWKSLDLFSADSPDRKLLDVFSIEDRATVTGKINPNLAPSENLKAILYGASMDPSNTSTPDPVTTTDADAVVKMFTDLDLSKSANFIHSGDKIAALLSAGAAAPKDVQSGYAGTGTPPSKIPTIFSFKTKTENFLRSLSSSLDTRNWQLMFDVVAQSGRITPSTSTNLQDFVVEGQKRFFVYLTLDRITGEIIDKHVEPVYE